MAREFSKKFYKSLAWKKARSECLTRSHGLCERCLRYGRTTAGTIVHHKIHLSPANINNTEISLSQKNLELVCRDCHAKEHPEIYSKEYEPCRVDFDELGNVVRREDDHGTL